jgi:hypothetical protein
MNIIKRNKYIQMKKALLFLIAGLVVSVQSYSQKNEYRYPAIKFGLTHGISPTPVFNANKYLNTPAGEMQLDPVSSAYVPGFVFDFLYHFDFETTDNAGIYTGIEYNYGGIGAKYNTKYALDDYSMKETFRYHMVGIPLAIQYGPKFVDSQGYIFAGAQINMVLAMSSVQKVNWSGTPSSKPLPSGAFNRTAFNLFIGVNYSAFNIQLDYYPNSFFNTKFVSEAGYKPYLGQVEHSFDIKTTVNVPYGWLSRTSFFWRKILRGTFWR